MNKISRKGFLKIAAAAAMSGVTVFISNTDHAIVIMRLACKLLLHRRFCRIRHLHPWHL